MSPGYRISILLLLLLPSCTQLGRLGKSKDDAATAPPAIPGEIMAGANAGKPVKAGGNFTIDPSVFTPADQIAWTDPDNPDAGIPELAQLMAAAPRRGHWEDSPAEARRLAVNEGKPLMILFMDSGRNPACKVLADDLLARKDFEDWCQENVVRLRMDATPDLKDPSLSLTDAEAKEERLKEALEVMKKRYKVLGYPTFIILAPNQEVVSRFSGYKRGNGDYTLGLLKQGQGIAANSARQWREDLQRKGYREWQDRSERNKVFAKLASYSKGTLVLVEPDGRRSKISETRLSAKDREWIRQQKEMRGIQ